MDEELSRLGPIIQERFGLLPDEVRDIFDSVRTEIEDGGRSAGGLLDVLIARQLSFAERAGDPSLFQVDEKDNIGGGTTIIIQGNMNIGPDLSLAEIAEGVADGVERASLGIQSVSE